MKTENSDITMRFLAGGGEMGELTRKKDWTTTSLGSPESWPQGLRTTLSIVLNSKFPMFLWWGPELLCFYNDAYRPSLGIDGKHPSILGMNAKEAWTEIWDIIKPLIDKVVDHGEAIWFEDLLVPIYRNGKIEDVYWTFSYSPVYENSGRVEGVLVTCTETTSKVVVQRQLQESERKLRLVILQAPISIAIFRGKNYITEIANSKALELWGRQEADVVGKPILDAMPELKSQGIQKLLDDVYDTGKTFTAVEFPVQLVRNGNLETVYVNFSYDALYNDRGVIDGVMTVGFEVTEQVLIHKRIEANEEKLSIVVDASELGTWDLNLVTGETNYSKRYLEILGYPEDAKLVHAQLLKHLHPDDASVREKAFQKALASGYLHYEARLIWNDQSVHWFEARGKLFYDRENKPTKLIGTIQDITKEKIRQQNLEQSEQRFRNFIMQSPIATVILKGREQVIEIANGAMLKRWNKTMEELAGKKFVDVFPELQIQKVTTLLNEVYQTGKSYRESEAISYIRSQDGKRTTYVDFEYSPLFEVDGKVSGIIATVNDVTERVEARHKIEESEQRYRNLIMQSPVPKAILRGKDHVVEMANDVMLKNIWRREEREVIGRKLFTVFPELKDQPYAKLLDEVFASGEKWAGNESRISVSGADGIKNFYVDFEFAPLIEVDKSISGIKITAIDVTERVEVRMKIEERESELRILSNSLEKKVSERTVELKHKNADLEMMNKELQSFAYISSHDLQEPLRKIQTFASRLLEKEFNSLSENGKDQFKRMQLAAERMQTLIDDLLMYSRTNTAERKLERVNLSTIIDYVKEDLKEEIKEKHAILEARQMCELHIIPFQFRQLMQNLVSNALKFSIPERAPHITITSKIETGSQLNNKRLVPQHRYCHITVSDNGIGFEPQYSEKIFELFQRLHGKREFPGTGIGLAIVKKIVENHNGIISAHSEPDKGATFEIFIPVN